MPNPFVPAAETGLSNDFDDALIHLRACPVEKLAREASMIIAASRALETSKPESKPDSWQETEDQLMERLRDLEAAATSARTRSAQGAMFQICALSDLVDEINEIGFNQHIYRRLRRALYSILAVLEAMAGARIETCRAYYMSPALDPFAQEADAA